MTSLLTVSLPVLMQVSRAEGGTLLPWPNGSVLSGRLQPLPEGAGALLILGHYRVRIEVPPGVPVGKVWLEVLQREKPGQFRLLTQQQALSLVTSMLHQYHEQTVSQAKQMMEPLSQCHKSERLKFPLDILPFFAEQHGQRLQLYHEKHGQAQGFVQQEADAQGFMLYGRLDLPNLGALVFALQGKAHGSWQVSVHIQDKRHKHAFEKVFFDWLKRKEQTDDIVLEGWVLRGLPEDMGQMPSYRG